MKFDCNLNLESFHWIVDCEKQQVAALMLSLLLVFFSFLLQMFSLVLVMFCLSFGYYLRCFLSRYVSSVVCGIFFVACNILIFVVSVFFVVTTPSSRFEIHLCANGQEVDVEGYTAHCANA